VELATRFQAELDSYAVASLASHVAGDDSRKAMDWLDFLDEVAAESKTKARANVVSSLAASDPEAAGSWLLEARRRPRRIHQGLPFPSLVRPGPVIPLGNQTGS
jgi:hypothetical protein